MSCLGVSARLEACSRSRRRAAFGLALAIAFLTARCRGHDGARQPAPDRRSEWFREVTGEVGLDFVHEPGVDGRFWMPESIGAGGAWLDYDSDGDMDLYLLNGSKHQQDKRQPTTRNRLLRQEADGRFVDVTDSSQAGDPGYGMGVAAGDLDNDGDVDLYVSNVGPDALYLNRGDGTFVEASAAAGIDNPHWGCSVSLVDFDGDGFLDVYVTNYVELGSAVCLDRAGRPDYCGPGGFTGAADVLYHNHGDGTFSDGSPAAIAALKAPGLGVVSADFNADGLPDLYVANDGAPNNLWLNRGDGSVEDAALRAGVAVNALGKAEAGMGVTVGDVDGDADLDLFVSHLREETNTLYRHDRMGGFYDDSIAAGVAGMSLPFTGFGTGFLDFDNDGDLDLAVVNGRVTRGPPSRRGQASSFWDDYAEPNFLLENDGQGRFRDVSARAGTFASRAESSRGLALGDADDDGDLDLLVTNAGGPARIFRNDFSEPGHWLRVRMLGPGADRDSVGARLTVVSGGRRLLRIAAAHQGYLSVSDPRTHFGLGSATSIEELIVEWRDGGSTRLLELAADRTVTIVR